MSDFRKWYSGKHIFITGGTGFMGKVLVEKMLRSFPDLGDVVLLVRPKRGVMPEDRLKILKGCPLFDKLKQTNKDALHKIKFVEGNISENNLGLNDEAIAYLINNISVVFHFGASLTLDNDIKEAVRINTLGTLKLLELCQEMKNVVSIEHISTAFCCCDVPTLEEKIYESPQNPYDILKLVNDENKVIQKKQTFEIISPHQNVYTFSKRLAEIIVRDYGSSLPLAICRPSVVLPAFDDPIPGWVDSLNGPMGILVAGGKGVLYSMLCNGDNILEVIPVDMAINYIIIWAYHRSLEKTNEVLVANVTSPRNIVALSIKIIHELGLKAIYKYPFEWMLYYPRGTITTNVFFHWLKVICYQWIPAVLIDSLIFITGRKPFLIRVQKKIMSGIYLLQFFTMKEWHFKNDKSLVIVNKHVSIEDKQNFKLSNVTVNQQDFTDNCILGVKKYILKESMDTLPYTRAHLKILYVLDCVFHLIFLYFGFKLLSYVFHYFY